MKGRILLLLLIGLAIVAFFVFDLGSYLTLANLKARQSELEALVDAEPFAAAAAFYLLYDAVTALSLPGAAILTLAAGAIFGLWQGTLIASFASTVGASLAFLSSRYLLRDWVKARFGGRIVSIDRGIARDGAFYLLTLRLIPAFPFFLVNLAMGVTAMRLLTFALVSQAGMLLGTLVYVNAGTQLAAIESMSDIFSPALIGSFVLLGLFPLLAKALVGWWKRRLVYRGRRRPRRFDRNLIVIGAGAGGLVTALIGATVRAKVTLIEKGEIGGGERLTARAIVIAAGGEPAVPDIPGLAESGFLTSDTMWERLRGRERVPERIAIIGGGPIGTEMAQAFARLGSKVIQIERGPRLLPREDEDASALIEAVLREEGVEILTGHDAVRIEGKVLTVRSGERESAVPFDELIVAVGRKARLTGYGLEELGIETGRTVAVNEWLETRYPNIYAVGDVAGPYQFTHFAAHQAWFAAVNGLFGHLKRFRADYRVLPWVAFTDPEVAHVGHNQLSAKAAGIDHEVVRYDLSHLDRALAEGANRGFVKLLVAPGKDRLLGATIVAANAGELLPELVLAMKYGLGLGKLLGTIHAYPTLAEANKYAAGEWKKANKPERLLGWLERYHERRLG